MNAPALPLPGLTSEQARARLRLAGRNELPRRLGRRRLRQVAATLREPMLLLLFACGGIYFLLGEARESALLLISAGFVATLTLVQQAKSENALERLRELASPRASVVRDGRELRIPGAEVVPEDVVLLREGDRVPADATLVRAENLQIDESFLTGESLPIEKSAPQKVYAGSLVLAGHGSARVELTGARTEFGRIGIAVRDAKPGARTRFQEDAAAFVRKIGIAAAVFCATIVAAYGWRNGDWAQGVLAGFAGAMAMMPEELPIVVTLFLALGAWRISRHQVLTRRISAIESLGTTTVLCVDKTGTLTENRMRLETLWTEDEGRSSARLLGLARLANHAVALDPMERAIEAAQAAGPAETIDGLPAEPARIREYPLTPEFPAILCAWRAAGTRAFVAAKGAPEALLSLCELEADRRERVLATVRRHAERGQRMLAVAEGDWGAGELPADRRAFRLRFAGLLGFADPIRPEVPAALRECREAGMRVIMITGDHPGTARAIGEKMGLDRAELPITGHELAEMNEAELRARLGETNVFARMKPEQKLRLVRALQARGEIVTMTGDGVNDAPSLQAADIGIAMGGRGTDVAREAADLVLLDDDFASIVRAIRLGRRIFDNVGNAIAYVLAIHIPIAGFAILPVLLGTSLVLLPPQIVLLEFIIDPACSFVFEAEAEDPAIMKRKPRDLSRGIFGWGSYAWATIQGMSVLILLLAVYAWALRSSPDPAHGRSLAFTSLILANLALIFANRSGTARLAKLLHRENRLFQAIAAGVGAVLILLWRVPALRDAFAFGHLEAADLAISVGVGLLALMLAQALKRLRERIAA